MLKKYKIYIVTALYWLIGSDVLFSTVLLPLVDILKLPFDIYIYILFYCLTFSYVFFNLCFSFLISNEWATTTRTKYYINTLAIFAALQLYKQFWFTNYYLFPFLDSKQGDPVVFLSSSLFQLVPFLMTLSVLKQYKKRVLFVILVSLILKTAYCVSLEYYPSIRSEYYIGYFEINILRAIYYIDILLLLGSVREIKSENKL